MITHIFALIGLVVLCAGWVLFQQWLVRQDPERKAAFKPGCGACGKRGCTEDSCTSAENSDVPPPIVVKTPRRSR